MLIDKDERTSLLGLYTCMNARPDDSEVVVRERKETCKRIAMAFGHYLATTGVFREWVEEDMGEYFSDDPIQIWSTFKGALDTHDLAIFAIQILSIVPNQAGCERVFSDLKIKQTSRRNRLTLQRLEKMTRVSHSTPHSMRKLIMEQVGASIRTEHRSQGLVKARAKRANHLSTSTLLDVPQHDDLLADLDDEDDTERGRILVNTAAGWRTEMAHWIAQARREEEDDYSEDDDRLPERPVKWKPTKLSVLFGVAPKKQPPRAVDAILEAEISAMNAIADQDEDDVPDDGAVEIGSDEEFQL